MITSAQDLYFHVTYQHEDPDIPIIVYVTPIKHWNEEGCLADNFFVESAELARQFEAAGVNSSELMESVYELCSYKDSPTVKSVTAKMLEQGFQQDAGFSNFLNEDNETDSQEYNREEALKNHYSYWDEAQLQKALNKAVSRENYEEAANIRDEINRRKNS